MISEDQISGCKKSNFSLFLIYETIVAVNVKTRRLDSKMKKDGVLITIKGLLDSAFQGLGPLSI
jgi:hypothetical protein